MNRNASPSERRRSQILMELEHSPLVRVSQLSQDLGVSEVSIRRDLEHLEAQGLLQRVHGGARANPRPAVLEPAGEAVSDRKDRIGRAAAALIRNHDRLIIDSGSTALEVARHISPEILANGELTVITASLNVVQALRIYPSIHILLLGGVFLPAFDILVGPQTIDGLKGLHADRYFIGTDGLSLTHGITSRNVLEAEVNRAMASAASEVILVTDSSKIGVIGLATIMPVSHIHRLITDLEAPKDFIQAIKEQGVEVVLV